MTPDDMEEHLESVARSLGDTATAIRALLLDYQKRGRALERQCDNMAFAINRVDFRVWTENFSRELKEDRATLKGKSHD